jgi:predicted HAD superfamily Cof-like phosphohydrolase
MTPMEMLREFSDASGGFTFGDAMIKLRAKLTAEEAEEVDTELRLFLVGCGSKAMLAKELADLLYVAYGTAHCFGIDLERVFAEVHRSNMSKLPATMRDDGKVLKGPNYRAPDLSFVEGS